MSILAWMGWHTLPAARLDDSEVGYQLKADLESYGCDTRYLTNTPDGGTTILDIMGIQSTWRGLGHTLLNKNYQNSVTEDIQEISDWIIYGDYFSKKDIP